MSGVATASSGTPSPGEAQPAVVVTAVEPSTIAGDGDELTTEELASLEAYKTGTEPAAPAPASPPANGQAAEPVAGVEPAGGKQATVPHAALHAEREEHKRTKASNAQLSQRLDSMLPIVLELLKNGKATGQPAAAAPAEVDPLSEADVDAGTDPIGAISQASRRTAALAKAHKEGATRQAVTADLKQLETNYIREAQTYAATEPNFKAGYDHWINSRTEYWKLMDAPAEQIPALVQADEAQIVQRAHKQKKSAPEVIFNLAKTVGFVAPVAAAAGAVVEPGKPTVVTPQPGAAEAVAAAAAALAANQGLGSMGGGAASGLELESLVGLSDEEFMKVSDELEKSGKLRTLMERGSKR